MKVKAYICILLIICGTLCACGTGSNAEQISCYYQRRHTDFSSNRSMIEAEVRNFVIDPSDYYPLLEEYIQGPSNSDLVTPFPEGCQIIELTFSQTTAHLVMNSTFSQLSGYELTVACACLCLTVQSITGYSTVEISARDALLDGKEVILMDANSIVLSDGIS